MITFSRCLLFTLCIYLLCGLFIQPAETSARKLMTHSASTNVVQSPEIEQLVQKLFAAKSVSEQQIIIAENQQLISPGLIEALISKANPVPTSSDLNKCESINHLALGLSQKIGYDKGIAAATNYLGVIYRKTVQYDLALECFKYSYDIYKNLDDNKGLSQTHRLFGRLYFELQNYPQAFKHFSEDLSLALKSGENYYVALARFNLGTALEELEQYDLASEQYKKSLELCRATKDVPPTGNLIGLMTDVLRRAGHNHYANRNFKDAISNLEEAVELAQRHSDSYSFSSALNALSWTYLHNNDPEKAMAASQKSLATSKGSVLAVALRGEAFIHSSSGSHALAIEAIEKAKAIVQNSKSINAVRSVYLAEGMVNYKAGRQQQAYEAMNKAIGLVEQQRVGISASTESGPVSLGYKYAPYGWMITLLASQHKNLEALNFSERSKSRSLFNMLNNPSGGIEFFAEALNMDERSKLATELFKLEIQIAKDEFAGSNDVSKTASLRSQFLRDKDHLKNLRETGLSNAAAAADKLSRENELKESDLLSLLPDEQTALLQFAMAEEQAFLFAVTRTGQTIDLRVYPLGFQRHQLRGDITRLHELIKDQDISSDLDTTASQLYRNLLGKAEDQLKTRRKLIIVPDGPLWDLPFMALKMTDGEYLVKKYAVSFAPSFNVLRRMNQMLAVKSTTPLQSLLAIGNPSLLASETVDPPGGLMSDNLGDLPAATRLVNEIIRFYNSKNSKVLTGDEATEEQFKALLLKYRILHLATHGLYNDLDPMRSSIVFSQTNKQGKEDGFFEARELAKYKLNAELVILSACETGRGQVRDGEGIIGLPWAVFAAGCPTTVVSQWKVKAESTADLMVALHTNLNQRNKRLTKAQALQNAALSLINGKNLAHRHPYHWAGFVVFGKAD